jgi:hypothetical protein
MAAAHTPTTIRLDQPGELAAALPHLLGFRPRESLVAVSIRGRQSPSRRGGRLGLTARVDLPAPAVRPVVVAQLVGALLTDRPGAVVLAVVSEAVDDVAPPVGRLLPSSTDQATGEPVPELPHRALIHEAVLEFAEHGVPVHDALLVRRGRWWSYDCARGCCMPGAGNLLPEGVSRLAAASALAGQVLEDERAALERRITPVGFLAAAGMARACHAVGIDMSGRVERLGRAVVAAESWAYLTEAVAEVAPGTVGTLGDRTVARLAWGLLDEDVRDRAMGLSLGEGPSAAEVLWTELTRRAPAPLNVAPATLLAVTAWLRGDGAMANVALERALSSAPGYRLARLLRTALDACLPPAEVRRLIQDALLTRDAGG